MKNWIPKRQLTIFALSFFVFSLCIYFLGFYFVVAGINKIKNAYLNTESESSKIDKALVIKAAKETNKEDIKELREFFIKKGDEVRFIEKIEEIAKINNIDLEIKSIDVKGKQEGLFSEDVVVKLGVLGSWTNLMKFVDGLNKMYFGVALQNLYLNTNDVGTWSGTVELIVYREK